MAFNSVTYLGFLGAVISLYWVLPASLRRTFVLLASVAFYASWNILFVGLPLLVAGVVFVCGKAIQADCHGRKKWTRIGVAILLATLAVFKYRVFLVANLGYQGVQIGRDWTSLATSVAFPIGISFYTFEAIAYLIDVRQGRVRMPGFVELCLFFFFWPNILSGPLVRARELMPQLNFEKVFEPRFLFEGFDRIIWGLVQKNVIANVVGLWVDRGFDSQSLGSMSTLDAWFLALAFGLQIYFDFAGYTNLAIGAARLIGVTLPENFRHPYHAATPADFWNRWHMTLSRWIRDYLFFPINAKWKGTPLALYLSLIGVMALVGLWHGAGWGFLVWGTMHGIYLAAYRIYEEFAGDSVGSKSSGFAAVIWRVATLVAVLAAWLPFRAPSLAKTASIWAAMFSRFTWNHEYGPLFYVFTLIVVLFCAVEPLLMNVLKELEDQAGETGPSMFRIVVRPAAYLCGLALFLLFDQNYSQFIYSQF
jgi:D-alanyl-lipoteichoic acid acyltransferase DltB (MBOAT superfamily)